MGISGQFGTENRHGKLVYLKKSVLILPIFHLWFSKPNYLDTSRMKSVIGNRSKFVGPSCKQYE